MWLKDCISQAVQSEAAGFEGADTILTSSDNPEIMIKITFGNNIPGRPRTSPRCGAKRLMPTACCLQRFGGLRNAIEWNDYYVPTVCCMTLSPHHTPPVIFCFACRVRVRSL